MVILEELFKKTSHNIYKNLNRGEAYFYNLLESIISHKSHELKLLKEEIAILKKLLIQNKGTLNIKNNTNNGHIILGNVFFVKECPCQEFSSLNTKDKEKVIEFMKKLEENSK